MTTFRTSILMLAATTAWSVFGRSATTVANGLFHMPTTWGCLWVPTPYMDLTIAHAPTLNNDLLITSGSIIIGAGGSLQPDATPRLMLVSGGPLTHDGTFGIDELFCQTAGLDDMAPGADVPSAHPVPASGNAVLFVRPGRTGTYRLELHDARGTSLLVLRDGLLQLPLGGMAPGVYTMALRGEGASSVLCVQ